MSRSTWLALGIGATAVVFAASANTLFAGPHTQGRTASLKTRCCFEATISVSVSLHAEYSDGPDPVNNPIFPYGFHQVDAAWVGHQIFEYSEYGTKPVIIGLLGGGSRFWAQLQDKSSWDLALGDTAQCFRVTTTDPKWPNPKLHWLETASFIHFVQPGRFIRVSVTAGQHFSGVFSKCGYAVSYHGSGRSQALWDGLNQPWTWTIKGPTRDRWRHGTTFQRVVPEKLPINKTHNGAHGGAHLIRARQAQLVVVIRYFPKSDLAAESKRFRGQYPLDSPGMRLVVDNECRGC